jgi:hypothetical protein
MNIAKICNENELFQALEQIAVEYCCNITTLRAQNADDLDFPEVSVWEMRAALNAAYELGRNNELIAATRKTDGLIS